MDPQKLASLDPKLREAYKRVMGTPIPQPQAPPPPPMPAPLPAEAPAKEGNPTPPPAPEPQSIPTPQPAMPEQQPSIPAQPEPPPAGGPNPEPPMPQPPVQPTNFVQMNSEVAASQSSPNFSAPDPMYQVQTVTVKKKNSMMPILFGIAGFFFVAVYTLFWLKIFNFKLPFLP